MAKSSKLTERQQFWLEHLRACERNGQSLKSYAAEHGLAVSALYEAKSRLKRRGLVASTPKHGRFARVELASETASVPPVCRIHLRNGTVVELMCTPESWEKLLTVSARLP